MWFLGFFALFNSAFSAPVIDSRSTGNSPASTLITSLLKPDTSNALITLTSAQESTLNIKNAAVLANGAYCPVVTTKSSWTCAGCSALSGVQILAVTGDGTDTPYVYVASVPSLNWLAVVHQGTNTSSLDSWINDGEFALEDVDPSLNNGKVPSGAEIHDGFQKTYLLTNKWVLSQVQSALKSHSPSLILVTGHSLGAALSTLTSVYLELNLQTSVPLQQIGFGQPRVGNSDWVPYYQSVMGNNQMRVTNYDDIVPHLPPEDYEDYEQPDNEIYITSNGGNTYQLCPGIENGSCSDQFDFDSTTPHDGPYMGVTMGTC